MIILEKYYLQLMLYSLNNLFYNIRKFIIIKHKQLMNNNPTLDEMNKTKRMTILKKNILDYNFIIFINLYQTIFYLCYNITNKLVFNDLMDNMMIESILITQDLDMKELRNKTEKVITSNQDLYSGIFKWIIGNCWLNALITNGYNFHLSVVDKQIINSINKSIELIEPMSKPLILFHGFESYSNYNEKDFKVGYTFTFSGILSKTTCFKIAQCFAQSQNYLQPKYLVVYYPIGSKHIGLDIKLPKYDEYEYIGKSGETFKIKKICKRFNGLRLETFYICDNLDY